MIGNDWEDGGEGVVSWFSPTKKCKYVYHVFAYLLILKAFKLFICLGNNPADYLLLENILVFPGKNPIRFLSQWIFVIHFTPDGDNTSFILPRKHILGTVYSSDFLNFSLINRIKIAKKNEIKHTWQYSQLPSFTVHFSRYALFCFILPFAVF